MARTAPSVHIIAGPTASGKSALALQRAAALDGVIINADSMQLYDALPLLTARPDAADMARAPHALYAVLPPGDDCSAAQWAARALAEIETALAAGKVPLVTGGTGLYLRALMRGLSPIPDVPPATRAAAMARIAETGTIAFHAALAARDPAMGARLHPHDTQRLVRAWEVLEATGRSLSYWQGLPPVPPVLADGTALRFDVTVFELPRAVLHERCDRRFGMMMDNGALEEVAALAALIDNGTVPPGAAITHALGFDALRAFLRGELTRADAIARSQAQTRQYVKRQSTWLRHQLRADAPAVRGASLTVLTEPP